MNDKARKTVDLAVSQLGNPYVFGAWGSECTPSLRKKYAGYNPEHRDNIFRACQVLSGKAEDCGSCKWSGKLAFDCRGFTHWILKQVGIDLLGSGATSQYVTTGNWIMRGAIEDMPDLPCCVFKQKDGKMQHTGYHIGGGRIIHCSAGVQEGNVSEKGWTHYGVPAGLYGASDLASAVKLNIQPTLRKGSTGEAVKELQRALKAAGHDVGEVDGAFGSATLAALKAFQTAHGLTVDGICGKNTWKALKAPQNPNSGAVDNPPEEAPQDGESEVLQQMKARIDCAMKNLTEVKAMIERWKA